MRVYQTFDKKNHEGKYYKEWDLPDGFPIPQGYVFVPPTEGLRNPKFNHSTSMWEECKDCLLEEVLEKAKVIENENRELNERVIFTESALLDLILMQNNLIGGDI